MLTVARVTGPHAGGYGDYLLGKATATQAGDYYLKDGERVEAPGRWISGAQAVGVDPVGRVTPEQLRALMDVRRPDTDTPLRPVGSTGEAVAALDATFSAPKSVSAVRALAGADLRAQLEAAHETAIDRALTYATAQVPMVRERIDAETVIHVKAREMIATGWRHTHRPLRQRTATRPAAAHPRPPARSGAARRSDRRDRQPPVVHPPAGAWGGVSHRARP